MRNKVALFIALSLLASLTYGCGQSLEGNIVRANAKVTIRGQVFKWYYSGMNAPGGSTINPRGNPLPGVYITLDGNSLSMTTTTDANGEYRFVGIPDGTYSISGTAEGYIYQSPSTTISIKPSVGDAAQDSIYEVTSFTWFDELAYITSYSPTPGTVIASDQAFTIGFTSPMDVSTVRITFVPQGIRSFISGAGTNVNASIAWSTDAKTATVTPIGNLSPNLTYRLQIDYSYGAANKYYPLDQRGAPLYAPSGGLSNTQAKYLLPYADYRVGAGGLPVAPSGLIVSVAGQTKEGIVYDDLLQGGSEVALNWAPSASGNITGYRVYAALSSAPSNYVPLEMAATTGTVTTCAYYTSSVSKVLKAFYGSSTVGPISTGNYPFINSGVNFKVVAYNGDGESVGTVASYRDQAAPRIYFWQPAVWNGCLAVPLPTIMDNGYYADSLADNEAYILFYEPVVASSLDKTKFKISGGAATTIDNVSFMTSSDFPLSGGTTIYSGVKVKANAALNMVGQTYTLTVEGVTDLSGNTIKAGSTAVWNP